MSEERLLAVFDVEIKGTSTRFSIYGEYKIETDTDYNNKEFNYPEFHNLTAKQVVGKKEVDFQPTGETWTGRKFVVADMIQGLIASLIQDGPLYTEVYLDEGLQELVDSYVAEDKIATTINGHRIPKWILTDNMFYLYELMLVTNEFIYYAYYEEFFMIKTSNHEVVSDNYFASVGYWESVEHIKTGDGEEVLLWGELPKED